MVKLFLDFRLDTPGFEISALRSSITTLERQLEELVSQRREEVNRLVGTLDLNNEEDLAEAQLAHKELEWEVDHTYPRVYRGALLRLVWAAYESGVEEVAEFIQERIPATLSLSDLRGRTTLERATKYFPEILRFDLFSSPDSHGKLREVELVRNSFAHANGHLARISDRGRKVLKAMITSGRLEEAWGIVRPTKAFLQEALQVVETELSSLVTRAKAWDDEQRERLEGEVSGDSV